jgi:hypothetical protein
MASVMAELLTSFLTDAMMKALRLQKPRLLAASTS